MSRTKRMKPSHDNKVPHEQRDNKSLREGSWGRNRKSKPYDGSKWQFKYGVEPANATGITRLGKLITKNANRSKKKTVRQKAKLIIQQSLSL